MSRPPPSVRTPPRLCLCVLMNHPYPANLPILRRIYAGRFTHVRFLVPFERLEDPDVITVYRGSYAHAAYLTDARTELEALDCDRYIVTHDDVLLNPKLSEETFDAFFPIGPDDGFIPLASALPGAPGDWVWWYGALPKLLYPKSLLFGAGVERPNLVKYLPVDDLRTRMDAAGVRYADRVRLEPEALDDVRREPGNVLLHGLRGQNADDDFEARSLQLARDLVALMRDDHRRRFESDDGIHFALPMPLLAAGYFTDFYIVPRSGFADFCHYVGVACAAGLFVEIAVPTLLHAVCERVRTAAEIGADFTGFDQPQPVSWFHEPRATAIHPFKLSALREPAAEDAFLEVMQAIARGRGAAPELMARAGLASRVGAVLGAGWHGVEGWGVWMAEETAELRMPLSGPADVRLEFAAILGPGHPQVCASLEADLQRPLKLQFSAEHHTQVAEIHNLQPGADGVARLTIRIERLVSPAQLDPDNGDSRRLGLALRAFDWSPSAPSTAEPGEDRAQGA